MFAPEPLHIHRRLRAVIRYTDGSVDEWRPVEPRQSNWLIDFFWLRHFKYQFSVLSGADTVLWKPLCQWLKRQAALEGLSVQSIQLIREYQTVQPPTSEKPLSEWQWVVMYEE